MWAILSQALVLLPIEKENTYEELPDEIMCVL